MGSFGNWLAGLDWDKFTIQVLGSLVGSLLGILGAWFLWFRRRMLERKKLQRGDSEEVLFQMHTLLPYEGSDEEVVLAFRNVGPRVTVQTLYDNLAAQALAKKLSDKTTFMDPVLNTEGRVGFEVLNTALGYIAGFLAITSFEREIWLFAMTCEDREVVRKKCLRCFLIRPDDLSRFLDWNWCTTKVRVEKSWHGFRIATLHRLAMTWQEETAKRQQLAGTATHLEMPSVDEQTFHERVRQLSLGLNTKEKYVGEPCAVNWNEILDKLNEVGWQNGV